MKAKQRIDQLLVDRNMAPSREKARALILAGQVLVDGQRVDKAGHSVNSEGRVEVLQPMRYVSRGGLKLEAALEHFRIVVEGLVAIDVGSSTGGFTDCLLQHGAARVYAIDVGTGQLDWKLRNDPRVTVREQVNARYLNAADFPEPMDLAVCDVAFISVTMILPMLPPILKPAAGMVVLVKPQFELERHQVGRGGIVRDPELHGVACRRVAEAAGALGFTCEIIPSPVTGAEGNQEFLLYARH
ncbi:MAG: TlyA family RNA methyltransferase [Bryobacteraceae bacterium]|jgi:23S rRNA (cytidine1920-2'-O)/16S rRNA (cytidine1409-2'-O)-methyltransferase